MKGAKKSIQSKTRIHKTLLDCLSACDFVVVLISVAFLALSLCYTFHFTLQIRFRFHAIGKQLKKI